MGFVWRAVTVVLMLLSICSSSFATHIKSEVVIGVLAYQPKAQTIEAWQPLADKLNKSLPEYNFVLKALSYKELDVAAQADTLDFVFTNPEHYIALSRKYSINRIATVVRAGQNGEILKTFGGTIVVRADNTSINKLEDIAGNRIAAVGKQSLGGFLAQAGEMLNAKMEIPKDDSFYFTDTPHDNVVYAVLEGKADVGFIRSGVLEGMVASGKIKAADLKIINKINEPSYPYALSTTLYPEWPFCASPHVNATLSKQVVSVLFAIPDGSDLGKKAGYYSWGSAMRYDALELLMQRLRVYPFDAEKSMTVRDLLDKFGVAIIFFLVFGFTVTTLLAIRFYRLKRELNEHVEQLDREVNARVSIEQKLRLAASVFEHSSEGIVITDANNVIVEVNDAFENLTGYSRKEVIGSKPNILKSGKHKSEFYAKMYESIKQTGSWQGELWNKNKKGELYAELLSISVIKDREGSIINYVAIFNDITQNKEQHDKMAYLVNYDPLTGLANRRFLLERLSHAVRVAKRSRNIVAIIFIDLDNFKYINDTLGHNAGDELLLQIVARLNDITRESDTLARMGGDEFVLLVENINSEEALAALAQKVVDAISPSYIIEKTTVFTSASVGVSMFPDDGEDIEVLMKKADMAMYQSKEHGKDQFCFFSDHLENELKNRLSMLSEIRQAITNKELFLCYQPQVDSRDGKVIGVEALVRWRHPEKGVLFPLEFLAFAEDDNLIMHLSEIVLSKAMTTLKDFASRGMDIGYMSINIADRQFKDRQFVQKIKQALEFFGIEPSKIKLELPEATVTGNINESILKLTALRDIGVKIAIDGFGTGYASIGHIKNFPVDQLKIDKSFVHNTGTGHIDENIIAAIIAMSQALGIEIMAVGVETKAQYDFLMAKGCYLVQGNYFYEPKTLEELSGILS